MTSVGTRVKSASQPFVLERPVSDHYVDRNRPNPSPTVRTDTDSAVRVTAPTADSTVFGAKFPISYSIDAAACVVAIFVVCTGSFAIRYTPIERCCVHRNRVGSGRPRDAIESVVSPAVHRGFGTQNPRLSRRCRSLSNFLQSPA